jgi:hypothetical protein
MDTPQGNQVLAVLANGHYAVGVLSAHSVVPADQQYDDLELALYRWYDLIHGDMGLNAVAGPAAARQQLS